MGARMYWALWGGEASSGGWGSRGRVPENVPGNRVGGGLGLPVGLQVVVQGRFCLKQPLALWAFGGDS